MPPLRGEGIPAVNAEHILRSAGDPKWHKEVEVGEQEDKKPLPGLAARQGPIGGWERAKLSFPVAGIRRPIGCRLPDAILRGQRNYSSAS